MSVKSLTGIVAASLSGDPWHGPSLDALLSDVTPEEAAAHPVPGAHSVLELTLHMAAWAGEVAARVGGRAPRPPEPGDFPDAANVSFAEARARLARAHEELARALSAFPEARLAETVGATRDAPLGSGVTFEEMVAGVAQHDAYHGGQVALLKRALRAR